MLKELLKEALITISFIFLPFIISSIVIYLIDISRRYPILDKYFFDRKKK